MQPGFNFNNNQQQPAGGSQPPPIGFFDATPSAPPYSAPSGQPPNQPPNQPGFQPSGFAPNQPGFQQNPGFQPGGFAPPPPSQPGFQQGGYQPGFQQGGFAPPPTQPGYQPARPQGGYAPAPAYPGGYQPQGGNQPYYNPQAQQNRNWNFNDYLRQIFMQIDVDRNNFLTPNELQQALARAQENFRFDPRTIDFILRRYDTNRDQRISFDEFNTLYAYLNDEYATFLMNDFNGNGSIETNELTNTLCQRVNSRLNQQTIQYLVQQIEQMLQSRITFDIFCRVNARFDILIKQYQQQRPPVPIEQFFMQQFFNDFF